VAIVDDDELTRRGIEACLADFGDVAVVASGDHEAALTWQNWSDVDVALVDAADDRHDGDHFPGVRVVEAARLGGGPELSIVVITGHFFDDALRRRMKEARADFFFWRGNVQDVSTLLAIIRDPDSQRRGVPDVSSEEELRALGIAPGSSVNRAIDFLEQSDGERPSSAARRATIRFRRAFGEATGVRAANSDGGAPRRAQSEPSMVQIERLRQWATRSKHKPAP